MENDVNQPTISPVYNTNNSNIFTKNIYVSLIVAIIIGLVVGFLVSKLSSKSSVQTITQVVQITPTPDPRILTDPYQVLKNPVFTEWGASVEGKVAKKGSNSFIVERDGEQVEIFIQQSITGFVKESSNSAQLPQKSSFAELKVGDIVRGGVEISRGTMDNDSTHHVFANVFEILNDVPAK